MSSPHAGHDQPQDPMRTVHASEAPVSVPADEGRERAYADAIHKRASEIGVEDFDMFDSRQIAGAVIALADSEHAALVARNAELEAERQTLYAHGREVRETCRQIYAADREALVVARDEARTELARVREAMREIVNVLGPDRICDCPPEDGYCWLREEAADALSTARAALAAAGPSVTLPTPGDEDDTSGEVYAAGIARGRRMVADPDRFPTPQPDYTMRVAQGHKPLRPASPVVATEPTTGDEARAEGGA